MSKQDYYKILGVSRDADPKQIKAAYRKLARKYHPDVNAGDKSAEKKFKELSEAFAVLSDPDKRARYDRGGHQAFGPEFDPFAGFDFSAAGLDLSDLLGGLFGGAFGGRPTQSGRRPGADLRMQLTIPLVDAVRGKTLELKIPRHAACSACRGRGRLGASACNSCAGTGRRRNEDRVKVRIPPGMQDGNTVRLAGKGDVGPGGGPAGDLFLELRVQAHPVFRLEGRNLVCDAPIGFAQAALGGTVSVQTLEGSTTITIPPGTRSGQKFRLRGRGVPSVNGQPPGDLLAVIQIHPPKKLDERSRSLLEEFRERNPDPG